MDTLTIGGDLEVHRLGFGAMRITGRGIWGPPEDSAEAIRLLRRVVELGVDLIDTADSYGPEVSENLIAEALHPYPGGARDRNQGRPPAHRAQQLRLERIDLYQLHSPDPRVPYEDSVGALRERVGRAARAGARDRRGRGRAAPLQPGGQGLGGRARTLRGARDTIAARRAPPALAHTGFLPWFPLATGRLAEPGGRLDRIARDHDEENVAATRIELTPEEVEAIGSASQG